MAKGMTRYEDIKSALKNNCWYTYVRLEHNPKRIIDVRRKNGTLQVKTMDGKWMTPGENHLIYGL